jgi:hypothetical protein
LDDDEFKDEDEEGKNGNLIQQKMLAKFCIINGSKL